MHTWVNEKQVESFCAGSILYELGADEPGKQHIEKVAKDAVLTAMNQGSTMLLICDNTQKGHYVTTLDVAEWFKSNEGKKVSISYTYETYKGCDRISARGRRVVTIEEVHVMGPWRNRNSGNQVKSYMIRISWGKRLPGGWGFEVV